MAVRCFSFKFVLLVFACCTYAQPNGTFLQYHNQQPHDTAYNHRQPQWPEPKWPQQNIHQKTAPLGHLETPDYLEQQLVNHLRLKPGRLQQKTPQKPEIQEPQQQKPQRPEPEILHQQNPQPKDPQQKTPEMSKLQDPRKQTLEMSELQEQQQQTPEMSELQDPQLQTPEMSKLQDPRKQTLEMSELQEPQQQNPEMSELQDPQQQTPEMTQLQVPQKQTPEMSELQEPQQQTPEMSKLQDPRKQTPEMSELQEPQQQTPEMSKLQDPRKQTPEMSELQDPQLQTPEMTQLQVPQKQTPEMSELQEPQQQTPEMSKLQDPRKQTPEMSELQEPQQQTPEMSKLQDPRKQTPEMSELQEPQQQTPETSDPQNPQQQHTSVILERQNPQQQSPEMSEHQESQQQHTSDISELQEPQQPTPEMSDIQESQQQTPEMSDPQKPQQPQTSDISELQKALQQTPQGSEPNRAQQQTPKQPGIPGPQLLNPQRPVPQWPLQQTPQNSEAKGGQQQTPKKPEAQWSLQKPVPQWSLQHHLQRPVPQWPLQHYLQRPAIIKSPDQRCQVPTKNIVQCGRSKITQTQCKAINCCHNGHQCYYGKTVTVQCTKDGQFVLVVSRDATLPRIDTDSIRLLGGNDSPCRPVGITSGFAIYQFPVTACGTILKEGIGYVTYENRIVSSYEVLKAHQGSITRDSHFELLFQCKYSATSVEALVIEMNTVPVPNPIAALGPLQVELRLAKGACKTKGCKNESRAFTSYYSQEDYPVSKVLRQPVYVEVRLLQRKDPNLVLMLDHCWATSAPSPVSLPQWELIIRECSYPNDKYLTTMVPVERSSVLLYPTHYKRFILEMFTFVDHTLIPLKDSIFIHCSTSLCHRTPVYSCEPTCNRQRRNVVAQRKTKKTAVVSSGEVVLFDTMPATA